MMKFQVLLLSAAVGLAGCQGSVVGDAVAGKEGLAKQDDEYCRSIGATPGTDVYVSCRMYATKMREDRHSRAWSRFNRSAAGMTPPRPTRTTCNGFGNTVNCTTY